MTAVAVAGLTAVSPPDRAVAAPGDLTVTILHTNDFHGNLQLSGSNPGAARVATKVNALRAAAAGGAGNTLLFDAGDMMQGSLLSNIQKGLPTIAAYRTLGYDAATFGNHEFDWGQTVLGDRIAQAEAVAAGAESPMRMIAANITTKDTSGACTWEPFNPGVAPYEVFTTDAGVKVGVIGVASVETPYITIESATQGLCFRDPADSILHYYDALKAASDVQVVLSHNGFTDGGYGYGFPVYGDQTLAKKLNDAAKPVNLIIGGHSHTDVTAPVVVGNTTVVQSHYAGRKVGQAVVTLDSTTRAVTGVTWTRNPVAVSDPEDPTVKAVVDSYASDPDYLALVNQPVGYAQVDLGQDYNGDNMMGDFVDDAIYGSLNEDTDPANDVDLFLNNPGGIRTPWCDKEDLPDHPGTYIWSSTQADCSREGTWGHPAMQLTYGHMFQILPFGNATAVGTMTGAQIIDLLNQSATLFKGALQPSGIRYKFYRYSDANPGPQPYAWGAYDVEVKNRTTHEWQPLQVDQTYKVGTNEFVAPAGQDGFTPFKYMKGITYWGDMLNAVNAYVATHYGSPASAYDGPDGDGTLDARITRNGDGDDTYEPDEIVPLTILHNNDSHGRLVKSGSYQGLTQLATIVKQERAHNPGRTLLLNAGDATQGDSMAYYFKSAGLGYAADGTALPPELQVNPVIRAMNVMGYDAMTLGNHEFNFGKDVFSTFGDFKGELLQANIDDTGAYGLDKAGVKPYTEKTVGPEGIQVAILGIGNHRIPSYELPSNVPGLTFTNPIAAGQRYAPSLQRSNDVVIALSHIGFTEEPGSVEIDSNVDTKLAATVPGIDAVIGGHSHTRPDQGYGPYKYLPAFVAGPNNVPVPVAQAYRYNTNLGELVLGLLPKAGGGYEVAARAGRYVPVDAASTVEDPDVKAAIDPYSALLTSYNNQVIGSTEAPIDALAAYTAETNAADLQADASAWQLGQEGVQVDVHLSGAMTNSRIAASATPGAPYQLKVADMFTAMPYENSLVVMRMNGPQLKSVLERSYRNYWYYKYTPNHGGYSYYTTCMLVPDTGSRITYRDGGESTVPDGDNVAAFTVDGAPVDFENASRYYNVSTVNYLAAGACNMSNGGTTLWPLGQIVADTQSYVRDAVINYVGAQTAAINPTVEGRLEFLTDNTAPQLTLPADIVAEPTGSTGAVVTYTATATDAVDGPLPITCTPVSGSLFPVGMTTVTCTARDRAGNKARGTFAVVVGAPVAIRADLALRNGAGGRDIAWVTAPDAARGAVVKLYRVTSSGKHVLVASKVAGLTGNARFRIVDRRPARWTTYVAYVGVTARTLPAWTPTRRIR